MIEDDVEIEVLASLARGLKDAAPGLSGTGEFSFEFAGEGKGGMVRLKLSDLVFKTENRADKSYRDMVGENKAPAGLDDDYEDDGTDVV